MPDLCMANCKLVTMRLAVPRLSMQPPSSAQHHKSASDTPAVLPSVNLSRASSTPVPELSHKRSSGSVAQLLNARLSLTIEEVLLPKPVTCSQFIL